MKRFLLAVGALFLWYTGFSQQHVKCGSHIALEKQLEDPQERAKYEAFQDAVRRYTQDPRVNVERDANGVRIIPVVFHILHDGGSENISKTKVEQQMQVLNEDYRRLNPDTVNTPQRFYGDTEYTHFVFTSDAVADFVDDSAYVRLNNRYGESFAFHFNNGTGGLADTLAQQVDNVVEINVSNNADTADLATALANAINAQNGFLANYVYDGQHRVEASTDGLGHADDVLLAGLWHVSASIEQQGAYLPADCNIEFRLATKDPLGNCTDGIVRVFTPLTNDANNGTGFKGVSYWNAYSYLNVWVVNNIDMDLGSGTVLGYAQFPASGLLSTDGITVIASNIDVRSSGGRTATHEVGHWLSLKHVWGDALCGSDDVADTPPAANPNFGVCGNNPAYLGQFGGSATYHTAPYNVGACGPGHPDGEMFNNYMDYSDDVCMNMFTLGQKARMDFTLEGDGSEPGIRSYLISQENLEATGVADPYTQPDCAPISSFYFDQGSDFATQKMICAGESVDFEETAYNGDVDDYLWTFEGGDPGTSTNANPNNITYNTPGVYDVSLQVSNAIGSDSETASDMVIVSSTTAQYQSSWGYVDSYWSEDDFLSDYVVFNQDGSNNKWEWYFGQDGGSTGWESVRMYNIDNSLGAIDELISPSYDLTTISSPTLQFRYSGAAIDNTPSDQLRIMVSDDCGESWSTRETFSGYELTNSGLVPYSYRPNAQSTWTDVEIGLGSFGNKPNVRVKFRWISGDRSNNFYIDDLTISGSPIGMQDLERQIDLSIAPNPTNDMTAVTMNLLDAAKVRMEFIDILGKEVKPVLTRDMSVGTHRFDIDMSQFTSGVYYLRIFVGNDMMVKKVVKN
ncbi:MAG: PKD domain-containing protein [Flavobacteriales bacterium]|nr:PKD domain-containing protein [Flavobacteriales bacterium]